jgi:hypothetical protein
MEKYSKCMKIINTFKINILNKLLISCNCCFCYFFVSRIRPSSKKSGERMRIRQKGVRESKKKINFILIFNKFKLFILWLFLLFRTILLIVSKMRLLFFFMLTLS